MELKPYAPVAVRFGLGLVFLVFGIDQWIRPEHWFGYLPDWVGGSPELLIHLNGTFDLAIGIMLLLGLLTRIVAILATLHVFGIALTVGFNEVAVRDAGLGLAALAIALHGPDQWCIDPRLRWIPRWLR